MLRTPGDVTSIDDGVRQLSGLMAAEVPPPVPRGRRKTTPLKPRWPAAGRKQAQQGAAQQPGSIAGACNSAVANIRATSWYSNGDWGGGARPEAVGLSTAIGVDAGDLARLLVQQGLSLHGDLITTRDASRRPRCRGGGDPRGQVVRQRQLGRCARQQPDRAGQSRWASTGRSGAPADCRGHAGQRRWHRAEQALRARQPALGRLAPGGRTRAEVEFTGRRGTGASTSRAPCYQAAVAATRSSSPRTAPAL